MGVLKSKWVLTANTVLLKIYKKYSVTRKAKIIHDQIFFFLHIHSMCRKKLQLLLYLQITLDNFANIFPIGLKSRLLSYCWNTVFLRMIYTSSESRSLVYFWYFARSIKW